MSNPRQLLSQVRRRRAQSLPADPARTVPAPAPVCATAAPAQTGGNVPPPAPPAPAPAPTPPPEASGPRPAPGRGHALYSLVMRSHDRMGTRHLQT